MIGFNSAYFRPAKAEIAESAPRAPANAKAAGCPAMVRLPAPLRESGHGSTGVLASYFRPSTRDALSGGTYPLFKP